MSQDTVNWAGLTVVNQTFAEAYQFDQSSYYDVNYLAEEKLSKNEILKWNKKNQLKGVLGLAFQSISNTGATTTFANLFAQNQVSANQFSLYLNR